MRVLHGRKYFIFLRPCLAQLLPLPPARSFWQLLRLGIHEQNPIIKAGALTARVTIESPTRITAWRLMCAVLDLRYYAGKRPRITVSSGQLALKTTATGVSYG